MNEEKLKCQQPVANSQLPAASCQQLVLSLIKLFVQFFILNKIITKLNLMYVININ
jgi:hypothetical protein